MDADSLSGEIGRGLQWLRKSLLLTQYQLASFTELDYRHYQNIETGRVEVKVETLNRICSTFGVGLATFFALLERKPWLTEVIPPRGKGNGGGDFYLFRVTLEQSCFRMLAPIRELLSKSGRDLAEGSRENLSQAQFPCLEIDTQLKLLWKNPIAATLWNAGENENRGFSTLFDHVVLREDVTKFFELRSSSFYLEMPLDRPGEDDVKGYAVVSLKPMTIKPDQTLFLAFVPLSAQELEGGNFVNMQNLNRKFLS